MWVDATGNCSPCYFWGEEYNIGNIKNQKFINIWNKSLEKSVIKGKREILKNYIEKLIILDKI